MDQISPGEILSLREMLQMESNALAKAMAAKATISDNQLKAQAEASILAAQGRIIGLQKFIGEKNIIPMGEVQ